MELHICINKASPFFGHNCTSFSEWEPISSRIAVYSAVSHFREETWTPSHQRIISVESFHTRCRHKIVALSWEDWTYHTDILNTTVWVWIDRAVVKKSSSLIDIYMCSSVYVPVVRPWKGVCTLRSAVLMFGKMCVQLSLSWPVFSRKPMCVLLNNNKN